MKIEAIGTSVHAGLSLAAVWWKARHPRLSLAPDRRIVKELISDTMDEIRKIRGRLWAPIWEDRLATGDGAKGRTAV